MLEEIIVQVTDVSQVLPVYRPVPGWGRSTVRSHSLGFI